MGSQRDSGIGEFLLILTLRAVRRSLFGCLAEKPAGRAVLPRLDFDPK